MHLECIPFPGPPEENELAEPIKTLNILNNSIWGDLKETEGNAKAKLKN